MLCFERSRESKLEHSNDRYIHFIKYMIIYNKGCKPTKISWVFFQVMNILPIQTSSKGFWFEEGQTVLCNEIPDCLC